MVSARRVAHCSGASVRQRFCGALWLLRLEEGEVVQVVVVVAVAVVVAREPEQSALAAGPTRLLPVARAGMDAVLLLHVLRWSFDVGASLMWW